MNRKTLFGELCFVVTILFALAGTTKADIVLSDFEDNQLDGWQTYAGNPLAVVAAPVTPGLGNLSMQMTVSNQYWGQIVMQNWANGALNTGNFNAGTKIDFDLVFPASGWLVDHAAVKLQFENSGGVLGDQNTGQMTSNLSGIVKDSIIHQSFDISSFIPRDPTSTGANLVLWVQPEYDWLFDANNPDGTHGYVSQTVYIDNVKISAVPEPAAIVLLAIAVSAAFLHWRKSI